MPAAWAQTSQPDANTLAQDAYDAGEYDTAEHYYLQALQTLADAHDSNYAEVLNKLGNCYYMSGKFSDAADSFRQLIKIDESLYGNDSLKVADDLFSLTRPLRRQGLWDDASPVILRTLEIRRKLLGDDHKLVAMSWMDLAVNYQRQGKYAQAEDAFRKTIAIREKPGTDPRFTAAAYHLYARLLLEMQRLPEAIIWQKRAETLCAPGAI